MKIFKNIIKVMLGLIVVFLVSGYIYFNSKYPEVTEAPKITIERTPERLARGEYLFNNVAGCVDCHSDRDFSKLSGPVIPGTEGKGGFALGEEMGLPGTFYAKNITPYALGSWTDGEIFRAITEGVNKDGKALFPIMPYLAFRKMDREDIYSIIAYVRTLKPIVNDVPASKPKFPMNFIMKTIPTKSELTPRPDKSNSLAYGKYMVEFSSCVDCHTPSEKGKPIEGKDFAGGIDIKLPGGVILRPANITPDNETGIGSWTKEQFIKTFKTRSAPETYNTNVNPGEFQTIMPWWMYGRMTDEDLGAIYDYLRTVPAVKNQVNRFEINKY
jgi:mono/diheme cytochrome c family protein